MSHDKKCRCVICELGMEEAKRREREQMEKCGWIAHIMEDDPCTPYHFNYHTHGLKESFDHPDLQIVLTLKSEIAHSIVSEVVEHIKEGKKFKHGDLASGIIRAADPDKEYLVLFINAVENNRNILRIILPDVEGNLEPQDMDPQYSHQHCNVHGE